MMCRPSVSKIPYLNLLTKCSTMDQITQIHTQLITTGLTKFTYTTSKLLAFYALNNNGNMNYATSLFDHIESPAMFDYNVMIMGCCSKISKVEKGLSFRVYNQMRMKGFDPNARTFPALVKSCSRVRLLVQVNGQIVKWGYGCDVYVVSSLISMYSRFGEVKVACQVFDESSCRNVVCWTSLVSGYCDNRLVDEGRRVFDSMPERTVVSCSAMVYGYVSNERFNEGIELFLELKSCGNFRPNRSLLVTILNACATVGAYEEGKWILSYIKRIFSDHELELGTALIDFYAKCGKVNDSELIFNQMPYKDIATWSAMILGLAINGENEMSLKLFEEMEKKGPKPNDVTFIGVFCACNHKKFVNNVWRLFGRMSKVYGIEPVIEHYGCMVDLLSRAGRIKEAEILIKSMKMEPDGAIWGSLLNGCFIHGYTEVGEKIGQELIELEPHHSGRYIFMSNIYASKGCWQGVSRLRKMMKEKEVDTFPGWSFVEIDGVVHKFVAGSKSHSKIKDIYTVLNQLTTETLRQELTDEKR